jgi:hypothetical protein
LTNEPEAMSRYLLDKFVSGQRSLAREHMADDLDASCTGFLIQAQFRTPSPIPRDERRSQERQEPIEIFYSQQMKGSAQPPHAHHRAFLYPCVMDISSYQPATAHTYRKCGSTGILRLNPAEFLDQVNNRTPGLW